MSDCHTTSCQWYDQIFRDVTTSFSFSAVLLFLIFSFGCVLCIEVSLFSLPFWKF